MSLPIFTLLEVGNIHAYCTRRGECSPEQPYSGFNVCHYTGDDQKHVCECRAALSQHFGIPSERMIIPRQTHSINVLKLTSLPVPSERLEDVDAIVTTLTDVITGVNTADCVPVVLVDPIAGVTGVAHAGWRGAAAGIVEATVRAMTDLGSKPSDIIAAMGPSICADCFEVGEEVAVHFDDSCIIRTEGRKPHVSLHDHIVTALCGCGVNPENIKPFDPELCTRCHPGELWSARKSGVKSGRVFTFVINRGKGL